MCEEGRTRQFWAAGATCRVAGRVPFALCAYWYLCVCRTLFVYRSHTSIGCPN